MSVFFKHILRNILRNKIMSILIVFSVSVSSSLLFVTLSISGTMTKTFEKTLRDLSGNADVVLHTEAEKRNTFFTYGGLHSIKEVETAVPEILALGLYQYKENEHEWLNIHSIDYDQLTKVYNVGFNEHLQGFSGDRIMISEKTALEFHLKINDQIPVTINNQTREFKISAISKPKGLFYDETRTKIAVVPLSTAQELLDCAGKANNVNLFLSQGTDKSKIIEQLSRLYPGKIAEEALPQKEIESRTASFSTIFFLIFFVTSFLGVFIIYSSLKIVMMNRLSVLGTFRSVGMSKRRSVAILNFESAFYGIISGLLALPLGILQLTMVAKLLSEQNNFTGIQVRAENLILTFGFALILSLLCGALPIKSVSKIPVKDIVLGTHVNRVKKFRARFVLGGILLAAGLAIPLVGQWSYSMAFNVLSLLFCFIGMILTLPFLAECLGKAAEKVFSRSIAPKNLRRNKSFIGTVTLISIGMAVIVIINSANDLLVRSTDEAFALSDYEIEALGMPSDQDLAEKIEAVEGVDKAGGIYIKTDIPVEGFDDLKTLYGMDKEKFSSFFDYTLKQNEEEAFLKLERERGILLSYDYMQRFSLKAGDEITLKPGGEPKTYKIAGIINEMLNSGNIAVLSEPNFSKDFDRRSYSFIAVKTSEKAEDVMRRINNAMKTRPVNLTPLSTIEGQTKETNKTVMMILRLLTLVSSVVGVIGILNNLILGFLERKRILAMLRSIGMSRKKAGAMLFFEAFITGFIGGLLGYSGGFAICLVLPSLLKVFEFPASGVPFDPARFLTAVAAGICICLISSVSVAVKASRLNIAETIKYE